MLARQVAKLIQKASLAISDPAPPPSRILVPEKRTAFLENRMAVSFLLKIWDTLGIYFAVHQKPGLPNEQET